MVYTFARFLICAHKCRTLYDFACSVLFCMCVYGYLISEISLESKHCHRMKTFTVYDSQKILHQFIIATTIYTKFVLFITGGPVYWLQNCALHSK